MLRGCFRLFCLKMSSNILFYVFSSPKSAEQKAKLVDPYMVFSFCGKKVNRILKIAGFFWLIGQASPLLVCFIHMSLLHLPSTNMLTHFEGYSEVIGWGARRVRARMSPLEPPSHAPSEPKKENTSGIFKWIEQKICSKGDEGCQQGLLPPFLCPFPGPTPQAYSAHHFINDPYS